MVNLKDIPLSPTLEHSETLELLSFWHSISRHKWGIAGLVFVTSMLATLIVYQMRPVYRSTTTMLIESSKPKVIPIEEVYSTVGSANRDVYQTQVEILKSRGLAKKVIQKLKLAQHPDFNPRQPASWQPKDLLAWVPGFTPDEQSLTEEEATNLVIRAFSNNVQVEPVRGSQLVNISFDSHDRNLAAMVPDTLADLYIENDLEGRLKMAQKASGWLTSRIGDLREKLDASERALQQYRDRERIVDIKGVVVSSASKQLEETTTSLVATRQRRAEAENAYNQVQAARKSGLGYESIPAVLKHPLVQRLREIENDAERKTAELNKRYGAEHPRMIAAEGDLKSARENTRKQVESVIAGITREFEVARANETALENNLNQSKVEIQGINRKEFQLNVLQREVAANRDLYEMFVNRFKETDLGGELKSTIARVVDPAEVQNDPYSPKKALIIAAAMVVALFAGILLAILLDHLDNTIKSSEDVENRLGTPLLGMLQRVKVQKKKGGILQHYFLDEINSAFAESIRTIRTGIMMSGLDDPQKVLIVTSTIPQEGKTTVAMNLAFAVAQMKRVVLVDADMRRPNIGRLLGFPKNAPGLSNLVAGTAQLSECIHAVENTGLHLIPSGIAPPNPLELLSSHRFEEILSKLKTMFDVIVIDSPPVHAVSDALVLGRYANAIIYVVKSDATPYPVALNGLKRLRQADIPVLGVVLNQFNPKKSSHYYGNYDGYSQSYGGGRST